MSSRNYTFQRNQNPQLNSEPLQSKFINMCDKFLDGGLESEESVVETVNKSYQVNNQKSKKNKHSSKNSYDRKPIQDRSFDQNLMSREQSYYHKQQYQGKQNNYNYRSSSQKKQQTTPVQTSMMMNLEKLLQKQLSNQEALMNYKAQLQLNMNHVFEDIDNRYIHLKNQLEIYYQDALAQAKLMQKNKNQVLDQKLNLVQNQIQQINRSLNRLSANLKGFTSNEYINQNSSLIQEAESIVQSQILDLEIDQDFSIIQEQDIPFNFFISQKEETNARKDLDIQLSKDQHSQVQTSSRRQQDKYQKQKFSSMQVEKNLDQKQSQMTRNKSEFQIQQNTQVDKSQQLVPDSVSSKSNYMRNKSFDIAQPSEFSQIPSKDPSFLLPEFETNEFQKEIQNLETEIEYLKQQQRNATKTYNKQKLLDFQELERKRNEILEKSKPFLESVRSETEMESGQNTQKTTPKEAKSKQTANYNKEQPAQSHKNERANSYSKGSAREKYQMESEVNSKLDQNLAQKEIIKANKQLSQRIEKLEHLLTNFSKSPTSVSADQQVQTNPSQAYLPTIQNTSQLMYTEPEYASHIIVSQLKTEDVDQVHRNQVINSPISQENPFEQQNYSAQKQSIMFQSQGKWNKQIEINIRVYVPHGYPPYSCYYVIQVFTVTFINQNYKIGDIFEAVIKQISSQPERWYFTFQKSQWDKEIVVDLYQTVESLFSQVSHITQGVTKKDWPRLYLREKS